MQTVTLNSVSITDKNLQTGQPNVNKKGFPFKMAYISFQDENNNTVTASEYLDQKFGVKDEQVISTWKAGDIVEVVIEISEDGRYTNFRIPSKQDKKFIEYEEKLKAHEKRLDMLEGKNVATPWVQPVPTQAPQPVPQPVPIQTPPPAPPVAPTNAAISDVPFL